MSLVQVHGKRLKDQVCAKGLTQKELAERSGVSRSQIVRLLKENGLTKVRAATANGLAQALAVQVSDLCDGDSLSHYRRVVAEEFSKMCFRGLGIPWALERQLEELFVDPRVCDHLADQCPLDESRRVKGSVQGVKRTRVSSDTDATKATDCVRLRDRVVFLGHPGCGKTTILKYLAYSAAVDASRDASVPIHVRIPQLASFLETDCEVDPLAYVSAWAADRGCENVVYALRGRLESRRSRCLVLFDGLDEVGDGTLRERVIASLVRFIRAYPQNTYVIASRLTGYRDKIWEDLGFAAFRIEDYVEAEQRGLLSKWSSILARANGVKTEEAISELAKAIFSNPRVRTLAANPLILTICILLHQARGGSLPRRRVDFYEKIADVFLETWEGSKVEANSFHESRNVPLDAREFRWLLSRLALAMQKAGRVVVQRWWVTSQVREYLAGSLGFQEVEAARATDSIIRYLSQRTGLLAEQGADTFAFSHRTVQEYFASLGIIDEADESESRSVSDGLAEFLYHPEWSEVVRLVAAQLTPATAEALIRRILDDPDPSGRFLYRGPFLALRCLSDGTTLASRQLTSELFQSLTSLGESRWLGLTMEAMWILDSLTGTRLESSAEDTVETILETARKTLTPDEFWQLHRQRNYVKILKMAQAEVNKELTGWAMQSVTVTLDDFEHNLVFSNLALREKDPDAWLQSADRILADEHLDDDLRNALIAEIGSCARIDPSARNRLKDLAASDLPPSLRTGCIYALRRDGASQAFLRRILRDQSEASIVRGACAASLRETAGKHKSTANELAQLLESGNSGDLRVGAARGLRRAALQCADIRVRLLRLAKSSSEPESLRVACVWSLTGAIGVAPEVTEVFLDWLNNGVPAILQRIAAQALAMAFAEDRLAWDREIVDNVENFLMHVSDPCPEALHSLEMLVSKRQTRAAFRLETIVAQALEPFAALIQLAFVFGSVARHRQGAESDVDLFVLGNVSLKELSRRLSEAEKRLGRQINPVILTQEAFRQKLHSGDPFLLDIYRREKIPILGPGDSPTVQELNHELRTMAAEPLVAAE